MKFRKAWITCIIALIVINLQAQTSNIKPLSVGDKVPDIAFENVLNYKTTKAKLSDFKGKIVILDFWNTSCKTCIAAFPKMDSLGLVFKDNLQIFLVNSSPSNSKFDSKESILKVLENLKKRTGFSPRLPMPIHDTILSHYFPRVAVPHLIWIDRNGLVIGITDHKAATADNINSIMKGKPKELPAKREEVFDRKIPLFVEGNGILKDDQITYRSLFSEYVYLSRSGFGNRVNEKRELVGFYAINVPLRVLIEQAYPHDLEGHKSNTIILDVRDKEKFQQRVQDSNRYCYDLVIPPTSSKEVVRKYIQEDLKRAFNVSVYRELRTIPCYVIKATPKLQSLSSKYAMRESELSADLINSSSIKMYFHNYEIGYIIRKLGSNNFPFIDETQISEKTIDVDFPVGFDLSDENAVIKLLESYGFAITKENRELEIVVVTDKS